MTGRSGWGAHASPPVDQGGAGGADQGADVVGDLAGRADDVVAGDLAQAGDGQRRGQHVAGHDRAHVGELLLAVHDPEQVDRLGLEEGVHRVEGQHDRERRWGGAAVVRAPDGGGELAHLLLGHRIGSRGWEGAADERLVDWHAPNLDDRGRPWLRRSSCSPPPARARPNRTIPGRDRPRPALTQSGCGPQSFREIRGRVPRYLARKLDHFPNDDALCDGLWLPRAQANFTPQGLAVDGQTAYVSGYDGGGGLGTRFCRVQRVDLRSGRFLTEVGPVDGAVGTRTTCDLPTRRRSAARPPRAVAGGDRPTVAARCGHAAGRARVGTDRAGPRLVRGARRRRTAGSRWLPPWRAGPALLVRAGGCARRRRARPDRRRRRRHAAGAGLGAGCDLGRPRARSGRGLVRYVAHLLRGAGRPRRLAPRFRAGRRGHRPAATVVRSWALSESATRPYQLAGGRPVVPMLSRFDVSEGLGDWKRPTCRP